MIYFKEYSFGKLSISRSPKVARFLFTFAISFCLFPYVQGQGTHLSRKIIVEEKEKIKIMSLLEENDSNQDYRGLSVEKDHSKKAVPKVFMDKRILPTNDAVIERNGYVWKFSVEKKSFKYHQASATTWGSQLASIVSSDENDFIHQNLQPGHNYYIGGIRDSSVANSATSWVWTDDSVWSYHNWNSNEPNNFWGQGGENCVVLFLSIGWNDVKCSELGYGVYKKRISTELGSICVDAPACAGISFLAKKEDREERCRSMEQDCPVACGHAKCYNFVRSCRDENRKELFGSLGTDQTCAWVDWMRTAMPGGLPNAWYQRVCLSNHQPYDDNSQPAVDEDGTAIKVYDMLVQERCPVACLNRECTCADNEVPFVTVSSINSETETEIEGIRARTCADLFNIASWEYRNVVCGLDIHAVTSQLPVPLKVYDMCPTACGFRPECFCRDSKADIPTPSKKQKTRRCKDAAYYPESGRNYWCNEMEQPTFARSCPIQCQNAYCTSRNVDSLDTISFNGGKLHTSCRLMSEGNAAYKSYCCNAMEDDLMVTGGALCPVTCAEHMNE